MTQNSELNGLRASEFPPPEPLELTEEEKEELGETIFEYYQREVFQRQTWGKDHLIYEDMYRGKVEDRQGPWEDSSNLHVQMPYWLVDSINTRQCMAIWDQVPLVTGYAVEDDDQQPMDQARRLVLFHLDPGRMNAFERWSVISRIRNIHGLGVGYVPYVKDSFLYRQNQYVGDIIVQRNPDGSFQFDEQGNPVTSIESKTVLTSAEAYNGPIIVPMEFDDVVVPISCSNLQPKRPSNPGGADFVLLRQYEPLSLIWKKRDSCYPYIEDDKEMKSREWWVDHAPSQDRTQHASIADNTRREKAQEQHEGRHRNLENIRNPKARKNPEFEILYAFLPWTIKDEKGEETETECFVYYCLSTKRVLGAYLLADLNWRNRRPLLELHYQKVGTRLHSMGVMEICRHLSAELDTLHNMRVDVGFAANMPYFLMRATATINPANIQLKPMTAVPVEDPSDIVFPPVQNVTTFYYQEEQLLLTLVERVMGVTDLFLGISPTKGAASRHATGFVGTQQEALARMSEIVHRDANAFSFLCHLIYEGEMQFGPDHRTFRLEGKSGPTTVRLNRHQLWLRGQYDFTLGANNGLYSQQIQQQRAQAMMGWAQTTPLVLQDLGRRWEVDKEFLYSIGIQDPERFIGDRQALPNVSSKDQDEENGEMAQMVYGLNAPAPISPNDDDQDHIRKMMEFVQGDVFRSLGQPNIQGFMKHAMLHVQALQQKQQMQMMQAQAAMGGGLPGMPSQPGPGPTPPMAANVAQLSGLGSAGQMGAPPASSGFSPPSLGGE